MIVRVLATAARRDFDQPGALEKTAGLPRVADWVADSSSEADGHRPQYALDHRTRGSKIRGYASRVVATAAIFAAIVLGRGRIAVNGCGRETVVRPRV